MIMLLPPSATQPVHASQLINPSHLFSPRQISRSLVLVLAGMAAIQAPHGNAANSAAELRTLAADRTKPVVIRVEAIKQLAETAPPGCRTFLQNLIADTDPIVAAAALTDLAGLDPIRALDSSRHVLADPKPPAVLQEAAIRSLGNSTHPDAIIMLADLGRKAAAGALPQNLRIAVTDTLAIKQQDDKGQNPPHAIDTTAPEYGMDVYRGYCAECHGEQGLGVPGTYPPITQSTWLEGDGTALVRIQLHGLRGHLEIDDQIYDVVMPPIGRNMQDEQIAAATTYMRRQWGDRESAAVSALVVAHLREQFADRTKPWTFAELTDPHTTINKPVNPDTSSTTPVAFPLLHWFILGLCALPMLLFLAGIMTVGTREQK